MLGVVLCISCMVCLPGEFFEPCGTDDICISCRLDPPAGNLNLQTQKMDIAFRCFLLEPDDRNEYLLCESVPASLRPYLRELGQHLRTQQEYGKEQKLKIADYENYIEKWAHEIKKPLSLMTLLLDNRKGEMSPLVHTRMLYVRDYARQSVEQILYFPALEQFIKITVLSSFLFWKLAGRRLRIIFPYLKKPDFLSCIPGTTAVLYLIKKDLCSF